LNKRKRKIDEEVNQIKRQKYLNIKNEKIIIRSEESPIEILDDEEIMITEQIQEMKFSS
jgi:hypothetical protein